MEEFDFIETPENVTLKRSLAGVGTRVIGGIIDSMILGVVYLGVSLILFVLGINVIEIVNLSDTMSVWIVAFLMVAIFLIHWGYFLFFEMTTNGQTPGKRYVKIRVVQKEGQGVTFNALAIRNLLRAIDGIGLYSIAVLTMFLTRSVQRLGDIAAGTVVVSEGTVEYSASYDNKKNVTLDETVSSKALEQFRLTSEEFRLLNNYWNRRSELTLAAREKILPKLLQPVARKNGRDISQMAFASMEQYVYVLLDKIARMKD